MAFIRRREILNLDFSVMHFLIVAKFCMGWKRFSHYASNDGKTTCKDSLFIPYALREVKGVSLKGTI